MLWSEVKEALAKNLPGYKPREIQDLMAEACELSWEKGRHILAEAGCGTGKSFVAAAAAYAQSIRSGKPVAIATETKALQDQYAEKDFPFLAEKVIPGLKFTVLKGRANYVCLARMDEMKDASLKQGAQAVIDKLGDKFSGEIADLGLATDLQSNFSMSSDECPGKKECPFGDVCFAEKAKTKAKGSHVVIANHALVAADMQVKEMLEAVGVPEDKRSGILPILGGIIIDEGHGFRDSVTNALGGQITAGSYRRLASETANFLGERDAVNVINNKSAALFGVVAQALTRRNSTMDRNIRIDDLILAELSQPMVEMADALDALSNKVYGFTVHGDDRKAQQKKRLVRKLDNASAKISNLVMADEEDLVRWLEVGEGIKGDSIQWAPLTVGDFLDRNLWSKMPSIVMSATLSVAGKFDFVADGLGIADADEYQAESPFDFATQAMTFVPDLPSPTKPTEAQWRAGSIAMTKDLVRASNGRALLLFTSRKGMDEAYRTIAPMVKRMGHTALRQGDGTNKALAAQFAADEHSVLFALKSFMTGVDFQGDSLRLVVIDKLPFPVPTDVIFAARVALQDRKARNFSENGFNKISVPTMALTLMQAYGRLIRTVTDKGVVAITDPRLYGANAKYYGKVMMGSLPKAPVTSELDVAVNFLEGLEAA